MLHCVHSGTLNTTVWCQQQCRNMHTMCKYAQKNINIQNICSRGSETRVPLRHLPVLHCFSVARATQLHQWALASYIPLSCRTHQKYNLWMKHQVITKLCILSLIHLQSVYDKPIKKPEFVFLLSIHPSIHLSFIIFLKCTYLIGSSFWILHMAATAKGSLCAWGSCTSSRYFISKQLLGLI